MACSLIDAIEPVVIVQELLMTNTMIGQGLEEIKVRLDDLRGLNGLRAWSILLSTNDGI